MKKKVLAIALAVALIAIMVSGSLAYFTANDEVTNTFTVGSVKIEIYENGQPTDSDTLALGTLNPVVSTTPSEDESYIDKVVKVKNTGANDAYIRTHIAIPTQLVGYLYLDIATTGWTRQLPDTTAEVDGVVYTVFTYDYNTEVTSQTETTDLLKGVYLPRDIDLTENANGDLVFVGNAGTSEFVVHTKNADGTYTSATINVLVASQAIQAQGFESGATAALDTGFGAETNPWAN